METFLLLLLSPRDVLCPCRRFLLLFWGPTDAPPSFRPWACPYSAPQVLRMFLVHSGHPRDVHLHFRGPTDVPSLVLGPLDGPSPFFGSYRCSFSISGGLTGGPSPFFGSLGWPRSVLDVLETLLLHFWILEMVFLSVLESFLLHVWGPLWVLELFLPHFLGPPGVPSPFFGVLVSFLLYLRSWSCSFSILGF